MVKCEDYIYFPFIIYNINHQNSFEHLRADVRCSTAHTAAHPLRCCNSCQELKKAYNDQALSLALPNKSWRLPSLPCLWRSFRISMCWTKPCSARIPLDAKSRAGSLWTRRHSVCEHAFPTLRSGRSKLGVKKEATAFLVIAGKVCSHAFSSQRVWTILNQDWGVTLYEVSGNIHVALGKSVQRDGKLVHEFNIEDIGCSVAVMAIGLCWIVFK